MKYFLLYLLLINYITFSLIHLDKKNAIANKRRIPEKNILYSIAMGGTIGGWIAMNKFKHKTKKYPFRGYFYAIIILQIVLFYVIIRKL